MTVEDSSIYSLKDFIEGDWDVDGIDKATFLKAEIDACRAFGIKHASDGRA